MRRGWRLAVALCVAFLPARAMAGMYTYTDEKGEVHFVDSLEKIPDEKLIELNKQGKIPPKGAVTPTPAPGGEGLAPLPGGGAGPGGPPPSPADGQSKTCALELGKDADLEMHDNYRNTTVRYNGKVKNTGSGVAKGVIVTLTITSPLDGRILDKASASTVPPSLEPGKTGTFSISGDYEKLGLHTKKSDKLTATSVRCD